jgi:hypothetical protein
LPFDRLAQQNEENEHADIGYQKKDDNRYERFCF